MYNSVILALHANQREATQEGHDNWRDYSDM